MENLCISCSSYLYHGNVILSQKSEYSVFAQWVSCQSLLGIGTKHPVLIMADYIFGTMLLMNKTKNTISNFCLKKSEHLSDSKI